jgi:uncharacterized membrane protein YjdF
MTFPKAFGFIAGVFLLCLLLIFTGVAGDYEILDIPLHFLGGFGWGLVAILLIKRTNVTNLPKWFTLVFTIGLVLIVGTLWEFAEYLLELAVGDSQYLTPLTLRDTLADLLNDSLGAITAWFIFKNKNT